MSLNVTVTNPEDSPVKVAIRPGGSGYVAEVTMILDTSQYASGDVLTLPKQVVVNGKPCGSVTIVSIVVSDEDDQGAAIKVSFAKDATPLGVVNSAPSISDTGASAGIMGVISIAATDYEDLGGVQVATKTNVPLQVKLDGNGNFWVSLRNGTGTPTYTVNGLKLKIGYV